MQVRELQSVLLIFVLFVTPLLQGGTPQPPSPEKRGGGKPGLAQKVQAIPAGTLVQVKLRNNEELRGRLGPATEQGFQIQYPQKDKILDRQVTYEQVKSFKKSRASAPQASEKKTLPESVLEIPAGTMVEVRLHDKSKIRGLMGPVSDEGFTLGTVADQQLKERRLAFSEVKSVKVEQKLGTMSKIALGALAGVAALALLALLVPGIFDR